MAILHYMQPEHSSLRGPRREPACTFYTFHTCVTSALILHFYSCWPLFSRPRYFLYSFPPTNTFYTCYTFKPSSHVSNTSYNLILFAPHLIYILNGTPFLKSDTSYTYSFWDFKTFCPTSHTFYTCTFCTPPSHSFQV